GKGEVEVEGAAATTGAMKAGAPPEAAAVTTTGGDAAALAEATDAASETPAAGADPREEIAAGRCGAPLSADDERESRAVILRGDASLLFRSASDAVDAIADGDLLWLCAGGHGAESTLVIEGRSRLTIAGPGAALVSLGDHPALAITGGAALHLRGLRFTFADEWTSADSAVTIRGVAGLRVEDVAFANAKGTGLSLTDVRGAAIERARFVASKVGVAATGGAPPTIRDSVFVDNERDLGGSLGPEVLGEGTGLPAKASRPAKATRPRPLPALPPEIAAVELATIFPEDETLATITWKDGERYAVLDVALFPEEPLRGPGCSERNDGANFECERPVATTRALPGGWTKAKLGRLKAVTASGPCALKVGAPVLLETSGCEGSITFAAPIRGCDDAAPLVTAAPVPEGMRWTPRAEVRGSLDPATIPAALRPWVDDALARTIADLKLAAAASTALVEWRVDLEAERWRSRGAALQLQLSECEAWGPQLHETTVEVGGGRPAEVELPGDVFSWRPIAGALALDGHLVAFVLRGVTETELLVRRGRGEFDGLRSVTHWSDHDECVEGNGPLAFSALCGP
ncbi:MAG: hypothetical protein KC486_36435, partial [Myxococcales bacterium]|nr:hypothetical protein [Myxococcales bacterium]